MSTDTRTRVAAVAMAALGTWMLPQYTAQAAGLGADWTMNETSGQTMYDSSGNENSGTLHTVATNGSSYGFNGSTSYVSVPSSASLNPGSANFQLKVTVRIDKRPATTRDYDLIRKGLGGTTGGFYKLEILDTGQALCRLKGSDGVARLLGGSGLSTGVFHTIACTKTTQEVTLVVDGQQVRQASVTVGSIANTSSVFIAAKPLDDYLDGSMNNASILPA